MKDGYPYLYVQYSSQQRCIGQMLETKFRPVGQVYNDCSGGSSSFPASPRPATSLTTCTNPSELIFMSYTLPVLPYLSHFTFLLPTCTPQVRARLLSLPRERVKGGIGAQSTWSHTTLSAQDAKYIQRLEAAFSQKESPELSVKTFCNLFKRL